MTFPPLRALFSIYIHYNICMMLHPECIVTHIPRPVTKEKKEFSEVHRWAHWQCSAKYIIAVYIVNWTLNCWTVFWHLDCSFTHCWLLTQQNFKWSYWMFLPEIDPGSCSMSMLWLVPPTFYQRYFLTQLLIFWWLMFIHALTVFRHNVHTAYVVKAAQ